ncbi:hypothetical protein [Streptomyces sp. NPDC101165]|uniref:hypothetical protein n=1 Tax=Streptomyces sp. NPDC101165 TaxID=3366119 RepID=UPI0037FEE1DB
MRALSEYTDPLNIDSDRLVSINRWAPETSLVQGLEPTYRWVYDQMKAQLDGRAVTC